jgi:hypothetical protein
LTAAGGRRPSRRLADDERQERDVSPDQTTEPRPGRYRHYRGRYYEVVGLARHSETEEELVVYRPLYPATWPLWVRPRAMFFETVLVDGQEVPRFAYVGEAG